MVCEATRGKSGAKSASERDISRAFVRGTGGTRQIPHGLVLYGQLVANNPWHTACLVRDQIVRALWAQV